MAKGLLRQSANSVRSQTFNIDNGSGVTIDEVMFKTGNRGARIVRVYCVYQEATQTVAAANFKVGTTAGGAELVAATAYVNSAAVGDSTSAVLVTDRVAKNTSVFVRHTGVAVTQTGTSTVVIDYVDNE